MKNFISFEESKLFVDKLNIKNLKEWHSYSKTKRPPYIPSNSHIFYKKEWLGFPDWLGYKFCRSDLCSSNFRKYYVNNSFFDEFSNDMAYILGFWYADGCIVGDRFVLTQCKERKYILKEILTKMESTYPVIVNGDRCDICINSRPLINSLKSHGATCSKSLTMSFPNIPSRFLPHFIRGYFDGDGSIGLYRDRLSTVFTCGSEGFLSSLRDTLYNETNIKCGSIRSERYKINRGYGEVFRLFYSHNDSIALCGYLYRSEPQKDLFLKEKYDIFRKNNFKVKRRSGFLSYSQALSIVLGLKCNSKRDYFLAHKKENLEFIPVRPDTFYKNKGWNSWTEWLKGDKVK